MSERQIVACIPIPGLNEWASSSNEAKTQLYVLIFIIIINNIVII